MARDTTKGIQDLSPKANMEARWPVGLNTYTSSAMSCFRVREVAGGLGDDVAGGGAGR